MSENTNKNTPNESELNLIPISILLSTGENVFAALAGETSFSVRVYYPFYFDLWEEDDELIDADMIPEPPMSWSAAPFDKYGSNQIVDILKPHIISVTKLTPSFGLIYKAIVDEYNIRTEEPDEETTDFAEKIIAHRVPEENPIEIGDEVKALLSSFKIKGNDTKH